MLKCVAGRWDVPQSMVAKCAFKAFLSFNRHMKNRRRAGQNLRTINLVTIDDDSTWAMLANFKLLLADYESSHNGTPMATPEGVPQDLRTSRVKHEEKNSGNGRRNVTVESKAPPAPTYPPRSDRLLLKTAEGVRVDIYSGNLIQQTTEVIVNAANSSLRHEGGVAKAIADAAGPELERESQAYIQKYGEIATADVMHTTSGHLFPPVKHVLHAVGPFWNGLEPEGSFQDIKSTFLRTLMYANGTLKVCSISIPAISSGW